MTRMNKAIIFFLAVILLAVFSVPAFAAPKRTGARWGSSNLQEFYDTSTNETVAVMAPDQFFDLYQAGVNVRGITDTYALQATNSGTAKNQIAGLVLTTGGTDTNDVQVALSAKWSPSLYATMEIKIAMGGPTGTAVAFGFSDAQAESAGTIAIQRSATTVTSNATDFCGFFMDSFSTTNTIDSITVEDGTDGTVTTGATFASDTSRLYRIEMFADGSAKFFAANSLLATAAAGSLTAADTLVPYIGALTHNAVTSPVTITSLRIWQRR